MILKCVLTVSLFFFSLSPSLNWLSVQRRIVIMIVYEAVLSEVVVVVVVVVVEIVVVKYIYTFSTPTFPC